jgi:predicted membrane-bound mannosyltransferase
VALHLLVTLLVYFLARRLTDDWLIGVLAAAVVGSFLCYLRRGRPWLAASLALYAVALLTKENAGVPAAAVVLRIAAGAGDTPLRTAEGGSASTGAAFSITLLFLGIRYKAISAWALLLPTCGV